MRVFITGGTSHSGSYIIPELIAAGHEVTGLARPDTAAAALSAFGAKVRHGDLEDLEGLMEASADSDGVIHVAHRQDLLPFGGMDAVSAAELPVMLAYREALAGTQKPLVEAGSIGSSGQLGRPATEQDPALPVGDEHKGTLRVRNVVETAVIDLAERGVRSSVVRIANIAHGTTDSVGFLPTLNALAKESGVAGYPGDGANLWNAVHIRDVASVFRLALEKGPAGKHWHAVQDEGIPFREIAEAIGSRLGLPAVSIPMDELMVPGYFGFLANIVTQSYPAPNLNHAPDPRLGTHPARPARRYGQRPLLPCPERRALMTLLDHAVLQVDDLDAIGDWYDQIVSLAGGARTFDTPTLIGYALRDQPTQLLFSLATDPGGRQTHLALRVEDEATVRRGHEVAIALGAEILHEPRLWPEYGPGYFAVFLRDPAGNNLELKCQT